jgi:hypothetical protein
MSYRYRCDICRTTSPDVTTRQRAQVEQDRHRETEHGGHIPDGDRIEWATPTPRYSADWRLAALGLVALAGVVGWIRHHI